MGEKYALGGMPEEASIFLNCISFLAAERVIIGFHPPVLLSKCVITICNLAVLLSKCVITRCNLAISLSKCVINRCNLAVLL